ncbi:MAG: hypothetical protein JW994_00170, partial [Candidatus Omnitrophica bacterium]|nr:hypothetical protein [Candidatus Omnitrophota bacterium]
MINSKTSIFFLILILVLAALIRLNGFWLSHWSVDEENYLGLAMKLDYFGFSGYNLRGINVQKGVFLLDGKDFLMGKLVPAPGGDKGILLKLREFAGITQYDIPLYYLAPAFPYTIMLSHRIFSSGVFGYGAASTSLDYLIWKIRPPQVFKAQFYAVIVPFFFSLVLIAVTFFLGKELFSERNGVYSSFIIATSAVDILCAQRIWPADMAAALLTSAVLIF